MMGLLLLLGSVTLWAAPSTSSSHLEHMIRSAARRDWPQATRIEVSQVTSQGIVPADATLIQMNPRPLLGAVNFQLAWIAQGIQKKSYGSAVVKVFQPVLLSRLPINPGEALNEENTTLQEQEISMFMQNGYFANESEVADQVARTFIRPSTVIHRNQVEKPTEIKQGQMVELIFENKQMLISARMKALDAGRTGQWIRLENPMSKRIIRAKVSASGRVALH